MYDAAQAAAGEIAAEIDRLHDHPLTRDLLDGERLREYAGDWPSEGLLDDIRLAERYTVVMAAMSTGRFMRRLGGAYD
jgi:hypothetical protein